MKMNAIVYKKYGPPHEVLKLVEQDVPVPQDHEVLIRVHAATVNRTDCAMLSASPFIMRFFIGFFKPKKNILGTDFAGEIIAVGKDVTTFQVGDRVFGFNDMGVKSHAQYMVRAADSEILHIPEGLSYAQATASAEGAHYAYNFVNKVQIQAGQKILVNGATGAIGSAAVQLLRPYDVHLTAVCATQHVDLVKSLGADRVIDYLKEDFTREDVQYDFVLDAVGKSSFANCKPILKDKGIYVSSELGWMAQNIFYALFTPLFGGKKVIFPLPTDIKNSLTIIKSHIEQGHFKAVIDRTYPLHQLADAFAYVEKGFKTGNVVITMD